MSKTPPTEYQVGDLVLTAGDPAFAGTVVSVFDVRLGLDGPPEFVYAVRHSRRAGEYDCGIFDDSELVAGLRTISAD